MQQGLIKPFFCDGNYNPGFAQKFFPFDWAPLGSDSNTRGLHKDNTAQVIFLDGAVATLVLPEFLDTDLFYVKRP